MTLRTTLASCTVLALAMVSNAGADVSAATIKALGAPDSVETRAGRLTFKDGVPTSDTVQKVADTLDFTRALNVYNNSFRGASALGIQKGFQSIGADYQRHRHHLQTDWIRHRCF